MTMSRRVATAWSAVWFLAAPGVVGGLVPWLMTDWRSPGFGAVQVIGAMLVAPGVVVVVIAFAQFVAEGHGTPIPVAPTETLVVGGLYHWVRNPMYVSVLLVIGGQALLFEDPAVLLWCVVVFAIVWLFVVAYEQPTLRRRYGLSYAAYCENVPGWYPRLTPWHKENTG
ncbi:MAG: methyltransferase family protein [Nocardioidaceae bacterium]